MFIFRGYSINNEISIGNLSIVDNNYYISNSVGRPLAYQVNPESLSVSYTGLLDKNGNQIFASFDVDGKMSKGGDIIEYWNINGVDNGGGCLQFDNEQHTVIAVYNDDGNGSYDYEEIYNIIWSDNYEIIGKQWEQK